MYGKSPIAKTKSCIQPVEAEPLGSYGKSKFRQFYLLGHILLREGGRLIKLVTERREARLEAVKGNVCLAFLDKGVYRNDSAKRDLRNGMLDTSEKRRAKFGRRSPLLDTALSGVGSWRRALDRVKLKRLLSGLDQ